MKLCVIIPTYNEADNIKDLIRNIKSSISDIDIIIVDDNSPDKTAEIAKNEGAIVYIRQSKQGIGSALRFGLDKALELGYDYAVTMDGDFSHDPIYIKDMLRYADSYDLVLGSRYTKGGSIKNWPFYRFLISKSANLVARVILGLYSIHDLTTGYKLYSRKAIEALLINCSMAEGYEFQVCSVYMIVRSGLKVIEVPIVFTDRRNGVSKLGKMQIFEWILYLVELSRKMPKLINKK
ncbi:MAG: dolichol-phosphate mannosyltransferase [Candidatus Micrarchaeota archaeon]|nr:MAG: dolichol-phosphate mannosyltransferase [Candidatus Micrarchaeota archaeon]